MIISDLEIDISDLSNTNSELLTKIEELSELI